MKPSGMDSRSSVLFGLLLVVFAFTAIGFEQLTAASSDLPDNAATASAGAPADGTRRVLLRIKTSLNGKPVDLVSDFLFGLAHVDAREIMRPISVGAVAGHSDQPAWIFLDLLPGTYHLWVIPPRTDLKRFRFQFQVPQNAPVAYVGSIEISCWSKSALFGYALEFCGDRSAIKDEPALAQAVARDLSLHHALTTSLMQPFGIPLSRDQLVAFLPLSLEVKDSSALVSPDWSKRVPMQRSAKIGEAGALMLMSPACVVYGGFVGIGTCFLVGLVGAGIAASEAYDEAQDDEAAQSKWKGCAQAIDRKLASLRLSAMLHETINTQLEKAPAIDDSPAEQGADPQFSARTVQTKGMLEVNILQAVMRECAGRGSLCLEIMVRLRLWSAAAGRYVFDTVFVQPKSTAAPRWSEQTPIVWQEMPFYNYDVPSNAGGHAVRTLDAYCGEDGARLLEQDIAAAIEGSAKRVLQQLSLKM